MIRTRAWSSLEEEGRSLVERLGGRWGAGGGQCRCPAHDDRHPSLSVRVGRTRLLFHCFAGCGAEDILRTLAKARLLVPETASGAGFEPAPGGADLSFAARRLWGAARPIAGTPACVYLASRGLATDSVELRFHPRAPHGPRPFTRFRPAIVAAVRDDRGLVAVHRSFLDRRGERLADIPEPRCGLGRFGRGAVRLGGAGERLGLAEGIETALSASLLFDVPCWATLGTERFAQVEVPAGVRTLLLFLDHDPGGRRAERLARARFGSELPLEVQMPRREGFDWNDVLRARLRVLPGTQRGGGG